ncbi:MAG: PEP-CTERM sorting domain-containing protein [Gammaproteobacteria bacterium]|nr:PEP-CTERM sorting domain-containing protein [Gammaproteobacteria bacterium]
MLTRASSKLLGAVLTATCLWVLPGAASATIWYDFSGTCETDCARFGVADGTDFSFDMALGLPDGTDTSAGARPVTVETFGFFGIDFTPMGQVMAMFDDDMIVAMLLTDGSPSADGNLFCYNVPGTFCDNERFDTIIGAPVAYGPAGGMMGHGPAVFMKHVAAAVPEPITPLLLGLGLLTMGAGGRQREDD